jgi:hypothetical protein
MFENLMLYKRKLTWLTLTLCGMIRWIGGVNTKYLKPSLKAVFDKRVKATTRAALKQLFDREIHGPEIRAEIQERVAQGGVPNFTSQHRKRYWDKRGLKGVKLTTTPEEFQAAENLIFRITQMHYEPDIYNALKSNDFTKLNLTQKDLIRVYALKLNEFDVICSHGRIITDRKKSEFNPVIWIPKDGIVAQSIMYEAHDKVGHQGFNATLAFTRYRFWVMSPSHVYKSIRSSCPPCRRLYNEMYGSSDQGVIPEARRSITRAFEVIGIDFAGPIFRAGFDPPFFEPPYKKSKIVGKDGKEQEERLKVAPSGLDDEPQNASTKPKSILGKRKAPIDSDPPHQTDEKTYYVMIITCANTRAVALYLMQNIQAMTMAMAWDQFCSEFGTPAIVYSDNGSNLERFERYLRTVCGTMIQTQTPMVDWRFIPAGAPWWGGFYERLVGMMKRILYRTCKDMRVPSELHANHLIKMVQHALNHRPLWGLNQDPSSLRMFTPNSFLRVDVPHAAIYTNDPAGATSKEVLKALYEAQHRRIDYLWKEFHTGYMSELAKGNKKKFSSKPLKVGDLVLFYAKDVSRNFWPIARITGLIMGSDGNARAAYIEKFVPNEVNHELRLTKYKGRSMKKLTPLEKRAVTGYFKPQKQTYPVSKLAPYEFWYNVDSPTIIKDDDDAEDLGVLPSKLKPIPKRQKGVTTPVMMTYHLQSIDCAPSSIHQTCKGGNLRIMLKSRAGKKKKIVELPITSYDDLQPFDQKPTKVSTCYEDLVTFCCTSSYYMASVTFTPKE